MPSNTILVSSAPASPIVNVGVEPLIVKVSATVLALGINAFFNSPSVASSINTWSAELSNVTKVLPDIISSGTSIVPTLFA